jgi:hypothetical protein
MHNVCCSSSGLCFCTRKRKWNGNEVVEFLTERILPQCDVNVGSLLLKEDNVQCVERGRIEMKFYDTV